MEYIKLGGSGLKISRIGLGGNNFGWWVDEKTSVAIVTRAVDLGITFLDTADCYDNGHSEEFIGKAIEGYRSQVILSSKFGLASGKSPNEKGASRRHIIKAMEGSLKRLKTDYIDLYQIHVPDPVTPIEETLRALDDLIKSGKVRYVGCCNFTAWQLCDAVWTSRFRNLNHFTSIQAKYNFIDRSIENELVPCCQAFKVGIIAYSPLAEGFLTGKYKKDEASPQDYRLGIAVRPDWRGPVQKRIFDSTFTESNWRKLATLDRFANERKLKTGQLALAWLLSKPWVSNVIAGARNIEQLTSNLAALDYKLNQDEVAELDRISSDSVLKE